METISTLLVILSPIALVIGLIKPSLFQKMKINNRKSVLLVFGGLFIVGVVMVGVFASPNKKSESVANVEQNTPNKEEQVKKEVVKISAVQLSEDYNANQVSADAKYKNKSLEISGIIESIGKDILDTPYVSLKGRASSFFGVQCMFGKADEPKLATLSKGQSIVLRGEVSGESIGNVLVNGCQIVE